MATRTWNRPWPGHGYLEYYTNTSNSNKVNGKVILRDSSHEFLHVRITSYGGPDNNHSLNGADSFGWVADSDDHNAVKARLAGKLHRGDASMGMTLATCGQSAAMLLGRFNQISDLMGLTARRRARRALRPRTTPQSLASDVLEVEFGWRPFIEDIANCMTTLCSSDMPPVRFRASIRPPVNYVQKTVGNPTNTTAFSGRGRLTATQAYSVSNPNVWLLNQLGLLNPFQVAWDRVPWSWVVNMFVNANQLINSFSNEFGLTSMGGSMTTSSSVFREQTQVWNEGFPKYGARYYANSNLKTRSRSALTSLVPTLSFRMPNLNWELAMIASALCVQRSQRLS